MKSTAYSSIFSPLYVLLSGSLGIFIALVMFTWNYPTQDDEVGRAFVAAQPFLVWVFLFAVLCCLLTIFILPAWGMLVWLLSNRIFVDDSDRKRKAILMLLLEAIFLTVVVFSIIQFASSPRIGFNLESFVPQGHRIRMSIMYLYTFLSALPALLGMLLIHTGVQELSEKIQAAGQTESRLFPLIDELLSYRTLLQNYLTIVGIILSMIPINTAGLRSILIALDPKNEQNFPITNVILFGLIFTILLLLIYVPAHLALTEFSRKLRDQLCPLDSLATLKQDMEQRKALDDLLQSNIGITQNLKTGLITLAPLATSLIASVLKVNIPL